MKQILLENKESSKTHLLVDSLNRFMEVNLPIKFIWKDVAINLCKILNACEHVVSMTSSQIITIEENLSYSLIGMKDNAGRPIRNLETFSEEVRDSLSSQVGPRRIWISTNLKAGRSRRVDNGSSA